MISRDLSLLVSFASSLVGQLKSGMSDTQVRILQKQKARNQIQIHSHKSPPGNRGTTAHRCPCCLPAARAVAAWAAVSNQLEDSFSNPLEPLGCDVVVGAASQGPHARRCLDALRCLVLVASRIAPHPAVRRLADLMKHRPTDP